MKGEPVGTRLPFEVAQLLQKYSLMDRVIVESFDLDAVATIKRIAPAVRTAALFEPTVSQRLHLLRAGDVLGPAKDSMADEVALHHSLARPSLIADAREAGFEVVVWTVDQAKWVSLAQKSGIKALITNNPAKLLKHRHQQSAERATLD
jgi:glycerophosphoryl diester phosphodiesterase